VSELIQKHLDAIAATMQIGLAQIDAARHALNTPPTTTEMPAARLSIPERCNGVDKNLCAEQDGEWVSKATLADFSAAKCKGCGHMRSGLG
jgi:hypothetical protein